MQNHEMLISLCLAFFISVNFKSHHKTGGQQIPLELVIGAFKPADVGVENQTLFSWK